MKELKNLTSSNNNNLLVVLPISKVNDVALNQCAYRLAEQTYYPDVLVLTHGLSAEELSIVTSILDDPKTFQDVEKEVEGEENKVMVREEVKASRPINYVLVQTEKSNFASMYNQAFNAALEGGYKWLSVLEAGDILAKNWYNTFNLFANSKPEFHGFMPFIRQVVNGNFTGFFHEVDWVDGMAEVPGVFDFNLLLRFNCINIGGTVLNVAAVKEYSEECPETPGYYKPMKESMKVSEIYEFFLRMVYNDLKFFTIPRLGYEAHTNSTDAYGKLDSKLPVDVLQRPVEQGGMNPDEYKFWTELAKNEYFFTEDRKTTYSPQQQIA